jgi:hypothetical protein
MTRIHLRNKKIGPGLKTFNIEKSLKDDVGKLPRKLSKQQAELQLSAIEKIFK